MVSKVRNGGSAHLLRPLALVVVAGSAGACVTLFGDFEVALVASGDGGADAGFDGAPAEGGGADGNAGPDADGAVSSGDSGTADFAVVLAAPVVGVVRGGTGSVGVTIAPQGGFAAAVTVTAMGLPSGITADPLTLAPGTTNGMLTLHAPANATLGDASPLTVIASSGALQHSAMLGLLVQDGSGALDVTFGTQGISNTLIADSIGGVTLAADGKIIVCGTLHNLRLPSTAFVARFRVDGQLDPSFAPRSSPPGWIAIPAPVSGMTSSCHAVSTLANGGIAGAGVVEDANQTNHMFIFELQSDGSFDPIFGAIMGTAGVETLPFTNSSASAVVTLPMGGLLLAGGLGIQTLALVRLTADGSLDPTFGTNRNGLVLAGLPSASSFNGAAVLSNGNVLASVASGVSFEVQRYSVQGVLDGTFISSGTAVLPVGSGVSSANSMVVQPDGNIVLAGHAMPNVDAAAMDQIALTRFAADGHADGTFGTGGGVEMQLGAGVSRANGVAVAPGGEIVIAGHVETTTGSAYGVARFMNTGKLDTVFAGQGFVSTELGPNSDAFGVVVLPDGRIVAVGLQFHPGAGIPPFNTLVLARYWP